MTRLNTCTGTHARTHTRIVCTVNVTKIAFNDRFNLRCLRKQRDSTTGLLSSCFCSLQHGVAAQWNLTAGEHQPYCVKAHRIYTEHTLYILLDT